MTNQVLFLQKCKPEAVEETGRKITEDKSTDTTDLVETRDAGTQYTNRDVSITEYLSPLLNILCNSQHCSILH